MESASSSKSNTSKNYLKLVCRHNENPSSIISLSETKHLFLKKKWKSESSILKEPMRRICFYNLGVNACFVGNGGIFIGQNSHYLH